MENKEPDFIKEIQQKIKTLYPDLPAFVEFVMPFIQYEKNYEKYLKILKKVGVKKGVTGVAEIFYGITDMVAENSEALIKGIVAELKKRFENQAIPPTIDEFANSTKSIMTFKGSMPYMQEIYKAAFFHSKKFESLGKKIETLPEDEQKIFNYFFLIIFKLWVECLITNPLRPKGGNNFIKTRAVEYYKEQNALYGEEKLPKELIDYVETIKIPDDNEQLKIDSSNALQKFIPEQMTIPVFGQVEDIFNVLQKHFDPLQHSELKTVLVSGVRKAELVFKSNGNQLADTFRRLFDSNLITGCNKMELIEWIKNNFSYKGKNGAVVPFTKKYLTDIISTNQKLCKNPVIGIKKEGDKTVLFSPDKKSRSIL